jgi:hypothetical protein
MFDKQITLYIDNTMKDSEIDRKQSILKRLSRDLFNKTGVYVDDWKQDEEVNYFRFITKENPIPTKEVGIFSNFLEEVEMEATISFFPDEKDDYSGQARLAIRLWYRHVGGGTNGSTTTFHYRVNGITMPNIVLEGHSR